MTWHWQNPGDKPPAASKRVVLVTRKYGSPGGGNFAYLVDAATNQYIVYSATITQALALYKRYHTYDPWSIRAMSDNE